MPAWVPLAVALGSAAASLYMLGLIWFVQVVHYPLMAKVGPDAARAYAASHTARTFWVTGPQMVLELALTLAAALLVMAEEPPAPLIAWLALGACLVNWVSTFLLQIPLHARLAKGSDPAAVRSLVRTNWIRAAAWSVKAAVSLALVWLLAV